MPRAGLGFGMFVVMRYGIARSIYANEAGYGTAAVAYGTAKTDDPSQQGLQAVMEVFIVSFVTATISAMTILVSGVAESSIAVGRNDAGVRDEHRGGGVGASTSRSRRSADGSSRSVRSCSATRRSSDGRTTASSSSSTSWAAASRMPYRWIYCLLIPFGAIARPDLVWNWGDLMNALQVFPNLVGLIGLSGVAAAFAWRNQRKGQRREGSPDS